MRPSLRASNLSFLETFRLEQCESRGVQFRRCVCWPHVAKVRRKDFDLCWEKENVLLSRFVENILVMVSEGGRSPEGVFEASNFRGTVDW